MWGVGGGGLSVQVGTVLQMVRTYLCCLTHFNFSSWTLNPLEHKATTYPVTQHSISQEWNPQSHCYANQKLALMQIIFEPKN